MTCLASGVWVWCGVVWGRGSVFSGVHEQVTPGALHLRRLQLSFLQPDRPLQQQRLLRGLLQGRTASLPLSLLKADVMSVEASLFAVIMQCSTCYGGQQTHGLIA